MRSILRAGALALAGVLALALAPAHAADNLAAKQNNVGATAFVYRAIQVGTDVTTGLPIFVPGHFSVDPTGASNFVSANPGFVSVTNFPGTWAITATSLPLPTGAATAALQGTANASLGQIATAVATAATAAKQPALGTAGTPSTDVLTIQGAAGGKSVPVDTVVQGTASDVGGTLTAGGTAQTFATASAARRALVFQNQSTGDLRINCSGVAATLDYHSLLVPAGALYETPPHHVGTLACSVIGATTGQAWYARVY